MANLSNIITPTNVLTATSTNTVTNKTLTDPKITLGGTNGTAGQALLSQGAGVAPTWATIGSEIIRVARTSNTAISSANRNNLIDITSGTFTQTFDACSSLGNGWFCYIDNSGTGDITLDPNASETIDGLTSYIMYPGEVRLVQCDGSALRTIVLNSFYRAFIASGTFTKPPGYLAFGVDAVAGGGSGATGGFGAIGGAGGAGVIADYSASLFGTTTTITIGSGGAAISAATTAGSSGGNTTVGSIITVYGGAGGVYNGTRIFAVTNNSALNTSATDISNGFDMARFAVAQQSGTGQYTTGGSTGWGGGGGAGGFGGSGGVSAVHGAGGAMNSAGVAPGGGGGGASSTPSGAGARGEVRIWGIA